MTEVQPGRYCLPDLLYRRMLEFEMSLKVLTTVVSRPRKGLAITDCGHKAIHLNYGAQVPPGSYQSLAPDYDGLPEVENVVGAKVFELDAEHGRVRVEGDAEQLRPGDKLVLIPAYDATPINQHDHFVAVRNEKVEAVWPIAGARKFQ